MTDVTPVVALKMQPEGVKDVVAVETEMKSTMKHVEREQRTLKWFLLGSWVVITALLAVVIATTVALTKDASVIDGGMLIVKETREPVAVAPQQQQLNITCAALLTADHAFHKTINEITFSGPSGEFTIPTTQVATLKTPSGDAANPTPFKTIILTTPMGALLCDSGSPQLWIVAELADIIGVPIQQFPPASFINGQGLRFALMSIGMTNAPQNQGRKLMGVSLTSFAGDAAITTDVIATI